MKQENTQKTFVIKTMTEKRYAQISASVRPIDLNIVDNDDKNRTVVASYDIVNEKFGKAIGAVDSLTIEYDPAAHALVLENGDGCYASVDVSSFIKDQVLKGVSADLNDERLEFTFETYSDDPRTESKFITASCLMPVDDSLDADSKNPIENRVVANKFTSVDTDISDLRRADKELSDAIFDSHIVRYVDGAGERRHIILKNNDNILGYGTNETGPYNLAMVSQWNKADFGSDKIELNLNAVDGIVTVNDHDIVVTENRDNTLSGTNTFTGDLCVDFGKLIDITSESSIVEISNDLTTQINTASSDLSAAISDEISDRVDADIALSNDITDVISTISSELSDALTSEISNRIAADKQLSTDIVGQLSAKFFDITKYGFENKAESQCVAGTDLITNVVDSIHAGNMTVIRVGGYDVLVNAVVDKAVGYNDVSGFCGYVLSAETTNGNPDKFIANATQIRVMFYSARTSSFMDLNVEDSDYKAIINQVSSDLSADYQKQIDDVNNDLTEISTELSTDYSEKINKLQADVMHVSADLSTDYSGKINDLCSHLTTEISEISSGLDRRVSSIEEDYLKRSDYDALSNEISTETKRADMIEHAICSYVDSHVSSEITSIGSVGLTSEYGAFEKIGVGADGKLSASYRTLTTGNISGLNDKLTAIDISAGGFDSGIRRLGDKIDACETSCVSALVKYGYCVPKEWVIDNGESISIDNKIVTQNELKKFDNTFRFAGTISSNPTEWADPTYGGKFKSGDIVLGKGTSAVEGKEWLLYLSAEMFKWEEIGDQNMYATKADLDAEKGTRESADKWLSGDYTERIGKVIAVSSDGNAYSNLSVEKISLSDFYTLSDEQFADNKMYVIDFDDHYDVFGMRIENVDMPKNAMDAVNLSCMQSAITDLSDTISAKYALSSDVSSKTELESEFTAVNQRIDSKTSCITTIWQEISGITQLANKNTATVGNIFEAVEKIYTTLSAFFI